MSKRISKPRIEVIHFPISDIIATSGAVNGSGKRPPGWDNPNNPHYEPNDIWGDQQTF